MNRFGAPFTQIVTSKGMSPENRLYIEDLDGAVKLRYHPDQLRIDEKWSLGTMPDIRSEVTHFEDTDDATYAKVTVQNPDGLPVVYEREFVFVKNRFLATRELVTFEESFRVRVSPIWNTHNIGTQIGGHWANTFIQTPIANNGSSSMKSPPVDLLVWFAPQDGCTLQVVDRTLYDVRTSDCPAQLRYSWEGTPEVGEKLVFTQVYYPHIPYRFRTYNNNPGGSQGGFTDPLKATAHASGITVLRDDVDASVLKLELEEGNVEYVFFNPDQQEIDLMGNVITNQYKYLKLTSNH